MFYYGVCMCLLYDMRVYYFYQHTSAVLALSNSCIVSLVWPKRHLYLLLLCERPLVFSNAITDTIILVNVALVIQLSKMECWKTAQFSCRWTIMTKLISYQPKVIFYFRLVTKVIIPEVTKVIISPAIDKSDKICLFWLT